MPHNELALITLSFRSGRRGRISDRLGSTPSLRQLGHESLSCKRQET